MKLHEFTVTGSLAFPIDMLRYDRCWPESGADAAEIEASLSRSERRSFTVRLVSINYPTPARWDSFCWSRADGHFKTTTA